MMRHVRVWKACLIWTLLVAAIIPPSVDIAAFGIHDHLGAAGGNGGELTTGGPDSGPSHHCDFWMSPGALLLAQDLPPLHAVAALEAPPAPAHTSATPSVPLSPPRV